MYVIIDLGMKESRDEGKRGDDGRWKIKRLGEIRERRRRDIQKEEEKE